VFIPHKPYYCLVTTVSIKDIDVHNTALSYKTQVQSTRSTDTESRSVTGVRGSGVWFAQSTWRDSGAMWKTHVARRLDGNTFRWHTSHLRLCELLKQHFKTRNNTPETRACRCSMASTCRVGYLPFTHHEFWTFTWMSSVLNAVVTLVNNWVEGKGIVFLLLYECASLEGKI